MQEICRVSLACWPCQGSFMNTEVYRILEVVFPILSMVAYVVSRLWVWGFHSAFLSVMIY